jgi:L-ascorbate metabolism protein UlaG (beta-lactamase superfamily)
MIIQFYGHSCFKITTKPAGRGKEDVNIFLDPFDKSVGLRPPQGQADLVLVSHDHPDHNNVSALKGEPRVIDIPGEYSAKGVNIIGINSYHDDKKGSEKGLNTIYVLETEDMRICHMGDLGSDLTEKQYEAINGIDILMIPVGGKYTLDGELAAKIVRKIEPKIVIPMHFKTKGSEIDIEDEAKFCEEMGNCPKERLPKINLKKKDLEEKSMEVIIMGIE